MGLGVATARRFQGRPQQRARAGAVAGVDHADRDRDQRARVIAARAALGQLREGIWAEPPATVAAKD